MNIQSLFQKQQHQSLIDYDIYDLSVVERLKYTLLAMCVIYMMGLLFYNHHIIALILSFF